VVPKLPNGFSDVQEDEDVGSSGKQTDSPMSKMVAAEVDRLLVEQKEKNERAKNAEAYYLKSMKHGIFDTMGARNVELAKED